MDLSRSGFAPTIVTKIENYQIWLSAKNQIDECINVKEFIVEVQSDE